MFVEYVRLLNQDVSWETVTHNPGIWLLVGALVLGIVWTLKK